MIGSLMAMAVKLVSGPYLMAALITAALAIAAPVAGFKIWLWAHDGKITTAAVARCEAAERADRLEAERGALIEARRIADATLARRGDALRMTEERIGVLESERELLRGQLAQTDGDRAIVFSADDEWLRGRPKAADAAKRR